MGQAGLEYLARFLDLYAFDRCILRTNVENFSRRLRYKNDQI